MGTGPTRLLQIVLAYKRFGGQARFAARRTAPLYFGTQITKLHCSVMYKTDMAKAFIRRIVGLQLQGRRTTHEGDPLIKARPEHQARWRTLRDDPTSQTHVRKQLRDRCKVMKIRLRINGMQNESVNNFLCTHVDVFINQIQSSIMFTLVYGTSTYLVRTIIDPTELLKNKRY